MLFRFLIKSVFIYLICQSHALANEVIKQIGTSTAAKPRIVWMVEDKQENTDILAKEIAAISTATYIEQVITAQLQQHFDIHFERVSMTRINYSMKNQANVCAANRANTAERRSYSIYSKPQAFYLTHKLLRFNEATSLPIELLNEKGEVSDLAKVFEWFPHATLGLADNISYGEYLDGQIAKVNKANIYYRSGNNRVTALEAMLYNNRVDFLIALPIDIQPTTEQIHSLQRYSIAGSPEYLTAYFNCSNSMLGKKIVSRLNQLLEALYQTDDYLLAHRKTFNEEDLMKLKRYLKKNFSEQSALPMKGFR
mgnify:CR=1 FL=1